MATAEVRPVWISRRGPLCEQLLGEATELFAFSLRERPQVFVLPNMRDASKISGQPASATTRVGMDALVVSAESLCFWPEETLRHELAHVFAGYWARLNLPFKDEGLAVYVQGARHGYAVDLHAVWRVCSQGCPAMEMLLAASKPYQELDEQYVLARSFAGFLVCRFGWEAYERFCRSAGPKNFGTEFEKVFTVTLSQSKPLWLNDLLDRRQPLQHEAIQLDVLAPTQFLGPETGSSLAN